MQSTFLQAFVPPIFMPEEEEVDSVSSVQGSIDDQSDDSDSDLDFPDEIKSTDEYKELVALKNVKLSKSYGGAQVEHIGYQVCSSYVECTIKVGSHSTSICTCIVLATDCC